ncbi:MAG: arsenate reductase ArsC [Spongiibacteraceae bacterium]
MKLLFICTHNRCRSILAEAIANHYGKGLVVARSAGSQPAGEVHPLSIKYLSEAGFSTDGLCSQSWDEHESWNPDVVITVCDSAAGESCPVWFGKSIKVHWGLADPSSLKGTDEDIANGFRDTISILKNRIEKLVVKDLDLMGRDEIIRIFEQLGNE